MRLPLTVACGVGVDSVAVLVGLRQRHIRPDLILFADVGSERQSTGDYTQPLGAWLRHVGFPPLTIVKYAPSNFKHWPPYSSLEENCLTNSTLPSIAYGRHSCSSKWKIAPQNRYLDEWLPARLAWGAGRKVVKAVGFEDSPKELRRSQGCNTYAVQDDEATKYHLWFPLQQWGWDRDRCVREIRSAGLPIPTKSACYFCTAMKPHEVDDLAATEPDKLKRIIVIEARAAQRHLDYAARKGWPNGVGVPLTAGLWRQRVKGFRGAVAKPGSMTQYIRDRRLLDPVEIDRIIAATPTGPLTNDQIKDWQSWLRDIIDPSPPDAWQTRRANRAARLRELLAA